MSNIPTDGENIEAATDENLKVDHSDAFLEDISLEGPDLEPSVADSAPGTPKSQAVRDLEGHESEAATLSEAPPVLKKARKKTKNPWLDAPADDSRYPWFFAHAICLIALAAWTLGAYLGDQPLFPWALALTAGAFLLTVPTFKMFHVRTRAGLAGLTAVLGLDLAGLYGPDAQFMPDLPLAVVWAVLLVVVWLWLEIAVWRRPDFRKNRVAPILSILLAYPVAAPAFAFGKFFAGGQDFSTFTLEALNQSPAFLTNALPWFFWPQTLLAFLVPPLAAVFLLGDQIKSFKAAAPDSRHLGGLWLSLAGVAALIFSFLSLAPHSLEAFPGAAPVLRALWPAAAQNRASLEATVAFKPANRASASVRQEPSEAAQEIAASATHAETAAPDDAASSPAAAGPPAAASEAAVSETAISEAAASEATVSTTSPAETSDASTAQPPTPSSAEAPAPTDLAEPLQSPGLLASANEVFADVPAPPSSHSAPAGEPSDPPLLVTATSLEVGAGFVPLESQSLLIAEAPPAAEPLKAPPALFDELAALTAENNALKQRLAVLETENELLKDRLHFNDQLLLKITPSN
ncbi:MAG: hypothetical protein LBU12_04620 [Deltaproteobacteria bacterium]|jgi:hypothetical protein|nr:hypothetical protein [Deltaproteobacteria bacterium]